MNREKDEEKKFGMKRRDRQFCVRCGVKLSATERELHAGLCDACNHTKEKIEKE